jgi:predicted RNase H-like HicB family nuclease
MVKLHSIPITKGPGLRSYLFRVVFERDKWPDEPDKKAIWRAYIPVLPAAHAWGDTQQEALENLKNAMDLIIADLLEEGKAIPTEPYPQVQTSDEPLLAITV